MTHRGFSRLIASVVAIVAGLLVTACGSSDTGAQERSVADQILAAYGLDGMDAREVIETLDALPIADRPEGLMAGVRPASLMLTDAAGAEGSLPMPADEFYVSIAPYVDTTHECYFHSLTTCVGELSDVDVSVVVIDVNTGQTLVDDTIRTHDNGFLGLWLRRDIEASITLEYDGRSSTSTISTTADDPTCITTLQLA